MAEIINLRQARKRRDRAAADAKAVENRAKFGRSRAEKQAEAAEKARSERTLDDAKLD